MSKQERNLLYILTLILLIVSGMYFYNFFSFKLSKIVSDWGNFGDYFGGVLNPLLTCILIYLVIKEGIDSRKNYLDSKQVSVKSQEQIEEQIRLLTPKPEIVYYLTRTSFSVFVIIENIGNAVAYNINSVFTFKKSIDDDSAVIIKKLEHLNYLAPMQKAGSPLGHRSVINGHVSIPEHEVTIQFYNQIGNNPFPERNFIIDKNILETLVSDNDIEGAINKVAENVNKLKCSL